jgi:hypothetical protein
MGLGNHIRHRGIISVPTLALFIFGCLLCSAPELHASPTNVASLNDELGRISGHLQKEATPEGLAALGKSLPEEWTVETSDKSYTISTKYLREQLLAGAREDAKTWVDNLATQLSSYSAQQSLKRGNARAELDHILAAPEFAAVHPPSAWDLFRQKLARRIERILERIFGGLARYPIGGQVLFWIIVIACVGLIALWVFRFVTGRERMDVLPQARVPRPVRTWQEWVRVAREAAARNDFREAVHSVYWAGITRLQDVSAVPKDPAKTPREYLRLVVEPSALQSPSASNYREPLSALTVRMEKSWYANRGASSEDFRDALQQLEALGCPLE